MRLTRRAFATGLAAGTIMAGPASAQALPKPTGRVILTVSGKIGVHNDGETAKFDREMLEALGQASFVTSTPWYNYPHEVRGRAHGPVDGRGPGLRPDGHRIRPQ